MVWQAVLQARPAFDEVNRLLDARLKLLALDIDSAQIVLRVAGAKFEEAKKTLVPAQIIEAEGRVKNAQLSKERAQILYDFFKSIRDPALN